MKRHVLVASAMVLAVAAVGRGQEKVAELNTGTTLGTGGGSDAQPVAVLLEQGVYQEETAGNLEAAAKTYKQIAAQAAVTRGLVAQALYRLEMVQIKQKQMEDARATLERLRTEYAEQKDLIAKAEGALPGGADGSVESRLLARRQADGAQTAPHEPTAEEKAKAAELVKQGWELMKKKEFSEASGAFTKAAELDPGSSMAWAGMGWAEIDQGQNGDYGLRMAIRLDPKNAVALNGMGWMLKNQDKKKAEEYWMQAVEADLTATSAMSGLAQQATADGRYDEAIKWYEMWLKADPQNADANIGLNTMKQSQAASKDALAAIDEFLKKMDAGAYTDAFGSMAESAQLGDAQQWEATWKAQRDPLGKSTSRKVSQTMLSNRGRGGGFNGGFGGGGNFTGGGAQGGAFGGGGRGRGGIAGGRVGASVPDAVGQVNVRYLTQFEHKKDVVENVVALKSDSGEWQVTAYQTITPPVEADPLKAR